MSDFPNVTLAPADPALFLCSKEKVKQGVECILVLEYSQGKTPTIFKSSISRSPDAKATHTEQSQAEKKVKKNETQNMIPTSTSKSPEAQEKRKRKKGGKKKSLESLLLYHQRLVEEKVLPPSRLMLKQAATVSVKAHGDLHKESEDTLWPGVKESDEDEQTGEVKCPSCRQIFETEHGLSNHVYI